MVQRGGFYLGDITVVHDMAVKGTTFFMPWFAQYHATNKWGVEAYRELESTVGNASPLTVIGPLLSWPDDLSEDQALQDEVTDKYVEKLTQSPEHGLLVITEIVREAWKERVDVYGELKEAVGMKEIWDSVDPKPRRDWERVLPELGPVGRLEKCCFFEGWSPPESQRGAKDTVPKAMETPSRSQIKISTGINYSEDNLK